MVKAIFLDKDGTLIPDIPYNVDPGLITLSDSSITGLRRFVDQGYILVVITNQAGVARGYFGEDKLPAVEQRLKELLAEQGVMLSGFYYCPHHPEGIVTKYTKECNCRKPQPGMLLQAAAEHDIDLAASWMIGDILNDVEAGNRAGCQTILINNGNETEWVIGPYRSATFVCSSINEAATKISNTNWHELAGL